ncbi:MAG: hypothetical protein MUE36_11650 [Acidimicrobiales bacterium]|nr:hypothetical protein [Acidimicrobiales bacterium]
MPIAKVSGPNPLARIDRSRLEEALNARVSSESWAVRILQVRILRIERELEALEGPSAPDGELTRRLAGVIREAQQRARHERDATGRRTAEIIERAEADARSLIEAAHREAASVRSAARLLRDVGSVEVPVGAATAASAGSDAPGGEIASAGAPEPLAV